MSNTRFFLFLTVLSLTHPLIVSASGEQKCVLRCEAEYGTARVACVAYGSRPKRHRCYERAKQARAACIRKCVR